MRLTYYSMLVIPALVPKIISWTIPSGENAIDGLYMAEMKNGIEVHSLINLSISDNRPFLSTRRSKSVNETSCWDNTPLNNTDTDLANSNLDTQCDSGQIINDGKTLYAKYGGTVAYYCNYSAGSKYVCSSSARKEASALITTKCGEYIPGEQFNAVGDSDGDIYGYKAAHSSFC